MSFQRYDFVLKNSLIIFDNFTISDSECNGFVERNGEIDFDGKNSKRKRKKLAHDEAEIFIKNGLINFTSYVDEIRTGKMIPPDEFEKSISRHIREKFNELKLDIQNGNHRLKRFKTNNDEVKDKKVPNGFSNKDIECVSEIQISVEEIDRLESETLRLLGKILQEKRSMIENLTNMKNGISNNSSEIQNNHKENDRLNLQNQEKYSQFIESLGRPIELFSTLPNSRIVESYSLEQKDKLSDSETENTEKNDDEKSKADEDLSKKDEIIRCICGILREEGQMIQCDKCEVNLRQ